MLAIVARSASGSALQARTVELDELSDHAALAQHLRDGEHEIGRGRSFAKLAGQLEPDDLRNQHRDRLPEHRSFGLDASHAPPEHAEPIHHRGVRVGADHGVGVRDRVAGTGAGAAKTTRAKYSTLTW